MNQNDQLNAIKYPNICHEGLNGLLSDSVVENLITSFSKLHSTFDSLIDCESSTISATSNVLFRIVDPLLNITGSSSDMLTSLNDNLPEAFIFIKEVIFGLQIQTLATTVTGAITDIRKSLAKAIQIVYDAIKSKSDITKKLNAAIISVGTYLHIMINTLAVIADATTKAIGSVSQEVQEAVVSLTLVLGTVLIFIQSVCALSACVLSSLQTFVSSTLNSFVLAMDSALQNIIGVVTSTTSLTTSISLAIGVISVSLTYLSSSLNSSLETIQASSLLETSNSLESILRGISGSVSKIGSSITKSVASLTSSIKTIASTNTGLLSTTASQLSPLFKNLSNLTGSKNDIVSTLTSSLSTIFDIIKTTSKNLIPGVGKDIIESLTTYVGYVQESLKSGLKVLSGLSDNLNIQDFNQFAQGTAKSIQYVGGIVVAISITIFDEINIANTTNLEALLSLQFILSAVLYVVQWVLSLSASISVSIAGSISDILSDVTTLTSIALQRVSKITATISSSLTANLSDILKEIISSVKELGTTVTSFKDISGVILNFNVKFDQLTSGGQVEGSTTGIVNGTEGTISEILSGLTGKLGSISPELTSSISSLTNTLKENASSQSLIIKVISSVLVLIVTQISSIAGSTSQVLSLISGILSQVFDHLATVLSKLSVLGDVSVSVNVSVSNIHSALRTLINAINECSGNFSSLDDPVKNVAKTVQILVSTLSAIVEAAGNASEEIVTKLFEAIASLPFIVSTIMLLVQQVLGAAIITMSVTFGSITSLLQHLIIGMSAVLKSVASITTDITSLVSQSGGKFTGIMDNLLSPVADLQSLTSSSLSVVSGVLANIKVSLGSAPQNAEL